MEKVDLDTRLARLSIDKERKRPRRRNRRWRWIVAALVAAGVAYGVYEKMHAPFVVTTARIAQETVIPGKGAALVTASGYVVPRHKVEVSSKIIGRVKEMKVKRGDHVNEGDVLLTIEDEEYQARVASAEAQVQTLRARVKELRAGSRPQEIAAAEAAVASAEATLRKAEMDAERVKALYEKGAISKQELDHGLAARDVAQAALESQRKSAELVKVGPRSEQIQAAEAQLSEAEAYLELAKTELGFTVLKAPISGTILEKLAEQGELVTNMNFGGTRGAKSSVVSMADLTDLQVEVDVNESELSKVKPEQKAEIRLDANPNEVYAGQVDEISPQADRQKGTVQVKVRILDPDDSIKTEVNARVTFLGDAPPGEPNATSRTRLWLPKSAIVRGGEGASVFVIEGEQAVSKTVKLGTEAEKGVEVVEGLTGTETVIAAPLDKLTDGARVVPAP